MKLLRRVLLVFLAATGIFFAAWLLPPLPQYRRASAPPRVDTVAEPSSGASDQMTSKAVKVSDGARAEALARAHVWRAPSTPIAKAYLGNDRQAPAEVDCIFKLDKPSGTTPKFKCISREGSELRVKYGLGAEIPAEAASTRLLAALGFGADSITIVPSVRCYGCPKEPFTVMKITSATRTEAVVNHVIDERSFEVFPWVAIERRFPAPALETDQIEGWAFHELDAIDPRKGGAPLAHVDALRLMSVFLAHWDNKAENQRLVCMTPGWTERMPCSRPFLMLQDVGSTFGPRKVDLDDWEPAVIWADRSTCTVTMRNLPVKGATFPTRRVSEAGRAFLAGLLNQLSDGQIATLFSGARFDHRRGPLDPATPVSEWVRAFKVRRDLISAGPACPT